MTARAKMRSTPSNSRPTPLAAHWLSASGLAVALLSLQSLAAEAGPCLAVSQPLLKLPEIASKNGVLSGTMILIDEQRRLIFRSPGAKPGQPGSFFDCQPQRVRAFISPEARPKVPPSPGGIIDPYPGPVLRARLGDIVNLTFVNQVDANRFGDSIDQGEKRSLKPPSDPAAGCDISSPGDPKNGYPLAGGDTWPDCFHGSSTGNIHFHGTHTNPNSTGDNVLLEVRPSPRDPKTRKPAITPESANKAFADFFKACAASLRADVLSPYPRNWDDAPLGPWNLSSNPTQPNPNTWTGQQALLLQAYDSRTKQNLWDTNQTQIDANQWPQYYIGAYPYCFAIPEYKEGGKLIMGQSPGTHWYHAHKHGSTAINVSNGMTGVLIIEGAYDDALNAFYGAGWTQTQPVMVINQLTVSPNLLRQPSPQGGGGPGTQDKGPDFTVNGRSQPIVDMAPGEVQMWRIANTSGRSGAYFGNIAPGLQWRRIAQDGVQFAYDNYLRSENKAFLMAAGNRVDLLMKAPATPGIYPVLVQHEVDPSDLAGATPVVLLQVRVSGAAPKVENRTRFIDEKNFPKQPAFLANITDAEVTGQDDGNGGRIGTIANPRVITFASTPPNFPNPPPQSQNYAMHTINGQKFEDGKDTAIPVQLNAVEEWKIENATYGTAGPLIAHPFHIHINPFQIVEIFDPNATVRVPNVGTQPKYVFTTTNDNPPYAQQCNVNVTDKSTWRDCQNKPSDNPRIWWDVFPIPAGAQPVLNGTTYSIPGSFRMRSRFVDYAGQYVLHCHILAHEDRGMMSIVQVTPAGKKANPTLYKHH